ncbi:MAG: hypothetical protein V1790_07085 [Planctomycetota bacterium]
MRFRLMAFGLGVLAAGTVVEASVFSLKAVKKNDVPIAPTASLSVLGGDKIEAEIFVSGWIGDLPLGVRTFQARIDSTGYVGDPNPITNPNRNGKVIPDGWCVPVYRIGCTQSSTCPPDYPICTPDPYGCACAPHNPDVGAFMNEDRSDFLLYYIDGFAGVDVSSLDYRYFKAATASIGVVDTGVPRYLGTLVLRVSANACGTFRIGFKNDQTSNFIADKASPALIVFPTLQPLVLTVSDCARLLVSCNPVHCNEDARIAHDRLDQNLKKNANTLVMNFSKPTTGMGATDFEVTVVPPGDAIQITSVTPNVVDPKITTVTLNKRIQQTRWTCIRDKFSNRRCCMGSLPGDADNSRVSRSDDIFEVFDNLAGGLVIPALAIEKCDTDRSLLCTPADLLMVVDLLNGAGAFDEVNGDMLPLFYPDPFHPNPAYECPEMRLPP